MKSKLITQGFYIITFKLDSSRSKELIYVNQDGNVYILKNGKIIKSTVFDGRTLERSFHTGLLDIQPAKTIPKPYLDVFWGMGTKQLKNPHAKKNSKKVKIKKAKTKRKIRKNCFCA